MDGVPVKKKSSDVFVFGSSVSHTTSTETEVKTSTSLNSQSVGSVLINEAAKSPIEKKQDKKHSNLFDGVQKSLGALELNSKTSSDGASPGSRSTKDASKDNGSSRCPPDPSSGRRKTENSSSSSSRGLEVLGIGNTPFGNMRLGNLQFGSLSDSATLSNLVMRGSLSANSYEVAMGRKQPIRPLLENGADPNKIHIMHPPLHLLLKHHGQNASVVDDLAALIEYGADVNAYNSMNQTPLMLALKYNRDNVALVELLLKNGADPNLSNDWKENCLEMAEIFRSEELIKLLKQYGAKAPNKDGAKAPNKDGAKAPNKDDAKAPKGHGAKAANDEKGHKGSSSKKKAGSRP